MLDRFLFNKPQRFPSSVASATGCGSVITLNEDCTCHKLWEPTERSKSTTWREPAAIDFSLESFAAILEGSLVEWFTNSQTAARFIEVGSMKLDLHRLAIKFFSFARSTIFVWRCSGSHELKIRGRITSVAL